MPDRDLAQVRAAGIVYDAVAEAYGFKTEPDPLDPAEVCACGHEAGTHHGVDGEGRCDDCPCPEFIGRDDWPVHQPECYDAPIPGRVWFAGCEPGGDYDPETGRYHGTGPRVNPRTGVCEGCAGSACSTCGREGCPDHPGLTC